MQWSKSRGKSDRSIRWFVRWYDWFVIVNQKNWKFWRNKLTKELLVWNWKHWLKPEKFGN